MQPNLFGLERDALAGLVSRLGQPAYRARQLYSWLYEKRVRSIGDMTNLSKSLRDALGQAHVLRWPTVGERRASQDGSIKYLFQLDDGAAVESVFIPEERRRTICISTQAGCPLKCTFCLTGIAGFERNLESWEILGQVATVMDDAPALESAQAPSWNIVVMGMGEPLLNYDATMAALRVLMDPKGFAVPPRKLTLSTVGILPALERLIEEPVRPNLAISLHAPNAALRRALMPIEGKYPLEEVIAMAERYPNPRGGRVTYEYVLLRDVNDTPAHARQLARLLSGRSAKVNLIPLNPAPEIPFKEPTAKALDTFCGVLTAADVTVSVRRSRGQDILAACGQLHVKTAAAGRRAPERRRRSGGVPRQVR
jgi:23S rRNA (adenine2503-C2)-methyltransferase